MLKKIATDKAPAAIGPYSQAIVAGDTLYSSGQIALDPATGNVVEGDIKVIWIDAKTGEYASMQGLGYMLFCCVSNVLLCVLILKFVKIKKE